MLEDCNTLELLDTNSITCHNTEVFGTHTHTRTLTTATLTVKPSRETTFRCYWYISQPSVPQVSHEAKLVSQ